VSNVDECGRGRHDLGPLDPADKERMIAGRILALHRAAEPAQCSGDERRALDLITQRDPRPEGDRRDAPREVLRDRLLVAGEEAHAELPGAAKQLVELRLLAESKPDERRLERQRDERPDGQAGAGAVELDGDDADAGRKRAHDLPQVLTRHHVAMLEGQFADAAPLRFAGNCGKEE
jgi:hypothetical protein